MTRYAVIGPTYPFRGGIANHTTLLVDHLRQSHETLFISFTRQYPQWLFPGQSDRDPSERPLQTETTYLIDTINPLTWRQALRQLRQWQPDVVIIPWWHPYFTPVWTMLAWGIKRLSPPPTLLYICHNVLPHEQGALSRRLLPLALRAAIGRGDGYILHSQAEEAMLHYFFPQARSQVTPHPTYAAIGGAQTVALPVALPDDRPLLLFCGFIRPYKGLDILLEALARVVAQRPLHLLVAGEFWQGGEPLYRQQIDRLQLAEHVTILNTYLPNEQLAACIDRCDVVVLPYRSATQSGVIQIAFGRGKPVITTDVGGLGEAVQNGRTGLVAPPEDAAALAAAIETYFAQQLREPFEQAIVEEMGRFSWDQLIQTIARLERP